MTENERKAIIYISGQMDASSTGICRAVFPDRKNELAVAGASIAVHLRRKGLVMRGHCQGTWRLTAKGRAFIAEHSHLPKSSQPQVDVRDFVSNFNK